MIATNEELALLEKVEAKTLLAGVADKAIDPPSPRRNDGA